MSISVTSTKAGSLKDRFELWWLWARVTGLSLRDHVYGWSKQIRWMVSILFSLLIFGIYLLLGSFDSALVLDEQVVEKSSLPASDIVPNINIVINNKIINSTVLEKEELSKKQNSSDQKALKSVQLSNEFIAISGEARKITAAGIDYLFNRKLEIKPEDIPSQ